MWKRLEHPNIAKFYGVSFQLGGRPALVMQWYENGTAPNYIKDRSMAFRLTLVSDRPTLHIRSAIPDARCAGEGGLCWINVSAPSAAACRARRFKRRECPAIPRYT